MKACPAKMDRCSREDKKYKIQCPVNHDGTVMDHSYEFFMREVIISQCGGGGQFIDSS